MLVLANQRPGAAERYGLSRADLEASAWAIDAKGRRFSGAASINRMLLELDPPWNLVGRGYGSGTLRWLEEKAYAWFAARRGHFARWGITPECDDHGGDER